MGWTEETTEAAHGHACVVLHLSGVLSSAELDEACQRVDTLIRRGCTCGQNILVCDVAALGMADLGLVDQLARLQLSARRAGGAVSFRRASRPMRALMTLIGLDEFLANPAAGGRASVEGERQAEQREQAGVEEDVEVRNPPL